MAEEHQKRQPTEKNPTAASFKTVNLLHNELLTVYPGNVKFLTTEWHPAVTATFWKLLLVIF